jgi:hypothetical protein
MHIAVAFYHGWVGIQWIRSRHYPSGLLLMRHFTLLPLSRAAIIVQHLSQL